MRQDQATCVQVESPAHRAAQRQITSRLTGSDMDILGNEQPLAGEEQHHHAFFASARYAPGKILPKCRASEIDGMPQNGFAHRHGGQVPGGNDDGSDCRSIRTELVDLLGKGLGAGRIDRAQGTEAEDQAACSGFATFAEDGPEYLRQDG